MALTKVRLPVADIAAISDGTSNVTIDGSGGDINAVVAGVTIGTFDATGLDLGALTLAAQVLSGRDVNLLNGTVATQLHSDATEGVLGTTSAHPLSVIANNVEALLVETDGQVQLGVEGTATNHLVTKSYVDANSGVTTADLVASTVTTGSLVIPNSTGNDLIINWGRTATLTENTENVVFDTPFPNAYLVGFVTDTRSSGMTNDKAAYIGGTPTTTGMTVSNPQGVSKEINWLAIGY